MKRSALKVRADRSRNRVRRAERRAGWPRRHERLVDFVKILKQRYPKGVYAYTTPPEPRRPRKIWVAA